MTISEEERAFAAARTARAAAFSAELARLDAAHQRAARQRQALRAFAACRAEYAAGYRAGYAAGRAAARRAREDWAAD